MQDAVRHYHAQIARGGSRAEVMEKRPEMLAAGIIKKIRELTMSQSATGHVDNSEVVHLRIGILLESSDQTTRAIETLRKAIGIEVAAAQMHVDHADELVARFGSDSLAPFQQRAAVQPLSEVQRMQDSAIGGEVVIFDEEDVVNALPQKVEDRLRNIGVLTVGKPTPPLNRNELRNRLASVCDDADFDRLFERYNELPLLEDIIEDPNIRRLCSALTTTGFETRYSCEGHGWMLAHAKFVSDHHRLEQLRALLTEHTVVLNEQWVIEEDHMDDSTIRYILHPKDIYESVSTRYDDVMADMDVIGMLVLSRFGTSVERDI